MDYQFLEYRPEKLVKLEILVSKEPVDALASIVHQDDAYHKGQSLVSRLKKLIPRQQFDVPIQAYASNRVISRNSLYRASISSFDSATMRSVLNFSTVKDARTLP